MALEMFHTINENISISKKCQSCHIEVILCVYTHTHVYRHT